MLISTANICPKILSAKQKIMLRIDSTNKKKKSVREILLPLNARFQKILIQTNINPQSDEIRFYAEK